MKITRIASLLCAACMGLVTPSMIARAAVPVIYCTDLFHPHVDPDDHFDLAALHAMPELDVKAIVLDQGAKQQQQPGAIPVSQMNRLTGRQTPVAIGLAQPLQQPADKALDQPAEFQAGVTLILQTLRASPGPVMIATVGSVRDVIAAFNREPELFRAKAGRLLVFIGDASHPAYKEYNVELDPHAYVGLMRSGLPVWWVPCFDGGVWQNRGHASFWKASHRDLLGHASPPLIQYFIYALEHEKANPLDFLSAPVDAVRKERLLAGERNLWCTTLFSVLAWPPSRTSNDLYGFAPVNLAINDDATIRYTTGPESRTVMRFEIRDASRYSVEMTRATAGLLEQLGTTQAGTIPSVTAFPLKVSENKRHLIDQNGQPFFVLGDTPWFLQKLPLDEVRRILDDRKAKGFNTLFLEILDDSAMPSRDAQGNVAFQPEKDITQPVEAYWKYADTVMDEATKRGFFIIMSELWYGAGEGLWMHHVTPESARVYGHFLGRRYARFQNLMWMHCGDRNPGARLAECARQLARAIQAEAPHHLHTAHLEHEFASSTHFEKEPWLDVNMAYTYGAAYLHVLPEYQRTNPIRPVILGETGYENEPNAIELLPDAKRGDLWTPYRIRRNAWWAVLSGASGYCAGTRLWRFEPGWPKILDAESIRQAPLIGRLLESLPWWQLAPDARHEWIVAGFGARKKADYVTAALADDGGFALAYTPQAQTLTVNLGKLAGWVAAQWYDPAGGGFKFVEGSPFPNQGLRDFTAPGANAGGDHDWVLVLRVR